jgi:hypothetical protein
MERVIVWQRGCPLPEPSREATTLAVQWRNAARERFTAAGAEILLELGTTIAFSLELRELQRALELSIAAVREAELERASSGGLTCAVAVGTIELDLEQGVHVGDAIDRAQVIANAGEPYEVLLDAFAQRATGGAFLFARELLCGVGLSAAVLDRAYPRRSDCQRAVAHLAKPPFGGNGAIQLDSLRRLAKSTGRHRVLLVAEHGLGISQWIERIATELDPPLWLDVRALGASLAPLASLMSALQRVAAAAAPEAVLTRGDEPDRHALATLQVIRSGGAVSRRDAVLSLRQYVGRAGEGGQRALLSVDPAPLIDPSTVGVVAEAAREGSPNVLVMMRLLLDSKPPEAFARGGGLSELRVRGLSQHEARALASAMLRTEAPNDIARRAAAMGGSNPLAVAEAVRVLVASGDVVHESGAFRWRRGAAGRLNTMSFESLIEERIDALAAPLRRALEVICALLDPDDAEIMAEVAVADGFVPDTWARALEELDAFGFVHASAGGIALSAALRLLVQATTAPARSLELNRSIASIIAPRIGAHAGFARATLAYHLARAGQVQEAASMFLEVATLAAQHGFVRSGVRLAAAAVECDPSDATRAQAAQLVERINERQQTKAAGASPAVRELAAGEHVRGAVHNGVASEAQQRAVHAILARDFDEVERAIELLVAAGRDPESVDRLRTVTLLAKGDHGAARTLVERLRERADVPTRETPRLALTEALVAIASADFENAVRSALTALAAARSAHDRSGERAALAVLAMCYRGLGREVDAQRLSDAALQASA